MPPIVMAPVEVPVPILIGLLTASLSRIPPEPESIFIVPVDAPSPIFMVLAPVPPVPIAIVITPVPPMVTVPVEVPVLMFVGWLLEALREMPLAPERMAIAPAEELPIETAPVEVPVLILVGWLLEALRLIALEPEVILTAVVVVLLPMVMVLALALLPMLTAPVVPESKVKALVVLELMVRAPEAFKIVVLPKDKVPEPDWTVN